MKKWKATIWRGNPQLTNGGYETTRTIEAKTQKSAWKKAEKIAESCLYGYMQVLKVEVIE